MTYPTIDPKDKPKDSAKVAVFRPVLSEKMDLLARVLLEMEKATDPEQAQAMMGRAYLAHLNAMNERKTEGFLRNLSDAVYDFKQR